MAQQGGTCVIIHTECCVCITDYSQNVSDSLQDLKSRVQAMADSMPPFGTALWNWISASTWWNPLVRVGSLTLFSLLFGPCVLNCLSLSLSLSLSVMSCIETVKLQMVMGMEPKSTCQDTIDHPTGGDRTAIH